jgi:hypothetical protein
MDDEFNLGLNTYRENRSIVGCPVHRRFDPLSSLGAFPVHSEAFHWWCNLTEREKPSSKRASFRHRENQTIQWHSGDQEVLSIEFLQSIVDDHTLASTR